MHPAQSLIHTMIKIAIVEDNTSYRKSLLKIIELADDMNCIDSFPSTEPFLKALNDSTIEQPDILLLDLNLPGEHGLKMLPQIKSTAPEIDVIILTQDSDFRTVLEALHLDAAGYLIKGASVNKIREVIRAIAEGGTYIDAQLSRLVLSVLCGHDIRDKNPLTPREVEILKLLALGLAQKEVAAKLNLSYHTVCFHIRGTFKKLDVPNLTAAVAKATRQGLI